MNKVFSVVGPTEKRWGQTYSEGKLALAIELPEGENRHEEGHEIIETIERAYEQEPPTTITGLKQLIHSVDLPPKTALVAALLLKEKLLLVNRAYAHAYIRRNGTFAELLTKKGALSGPLQDNDQLILTTPSFSQVITKVRLKDIVLQTPEDELEDELATTVQNTEQNDGAACIVTIVRHKKNKIDEEILESSDENDKKLEDQKEDVYEENISEELSKKDNPIPITEQRPSLFNRTRTSLSMSNLLYSKHRRMTASIGLILAVLLIASLVFGADHKKRSLQKQSYEEVIANTEEPLESARSLIALNPQDAYEQLIDIEATITQTRDLFPEDSEEFQLLSQKLDEIGVYILESQRIYTISDVPVFFDLSWTKDGAKGSKMALYDGSLIIVDPDNQSSYLVSLESKESEIIASDSILRNASDVSIHGETTSYLLSENGQEILNKNLKKAVDQDEDWGEIVSTFAYTGNLYLLDKNGQIWKYPAQNTSYGARQSYLSSEAEVDFERAIDMSIDGAIWVLTESNILKFAIGRPDVFFIQNEGLSSPKAIYTNEDLDHLYVLEDTRIIVLDKEGNYHQQYTWDGIDKAQDIVVSKNQNKIIVLSEGKLYGIDITK